MNVSFISLGCDKNRVNTEQMMALCLQAGHTVQEDCSGSDVVVINTCGFIDSAKSEAIDTILAAAELKAAAQTIYRALGCRGFARVDMFLTPEGRIVFNEVNTIPGFTAHSRFPRMMEAAGYSLRQVVSLAIDLALEGDKALEGGSR